MTTQRGNSAPEREQEHHDARHRVNRLLAAFLAAIPFAAVLNLLQDWLGGGISASQTGLLAGVLGLLAFLVYATMTASADTADEGRATREALRALRAIILQVNEHIPVNGLPESAHFQLTGIHIIEDAKGDVVNHYLDWFRELQHGQRSLTLDDLRSRDDQHPVA
ncbi:hypothetical protein GA0115240_141618 [Streptomyces sp. DvalAA-14]|uniref:hypothetical protein n=1 Tax=unclassified Streptomyces TaxID=2593676 RepID=UPI00081B9228|nr:MULTISPECIES: hypothetical protein [unclassified Streptomyces]MYS22430.1 hypothetical protein [Streptomyces sp. SID4948]SCE16081.1 hypothetical protein GA0115240_141618 [Streptomyces sp. DvalAA-14]